MRDLMVLIGLVFLIPLALSNVFAAYLIWGWTGIVAIDSYVFGFAQNFRLNLIFAIITLLVFFVSKNKCGVKEYSSPAVALFVFWIIQATASAVFAFSGNPNNFEIYERLMKAMVFVLLMPCLVKERYQVHAMVVMIVLGLAFHGLIDGLKFFASGGSHLVRGLAKFGDNNHFAALMVMVLPLLIYLGQYSANKIFRIGVYATTLIIVAAIIGTHSRGGFIGLMAIGFMLLLASRKKFTAIFLVAIGAMIVINFAPQNWTDRMGTIQEAEQDVSFMGRVEAWQVSSAIALSNPLLGGGFHAVQMQYVWERYRASLGLLSWMNMDVSQYYRAAHSIYFEVLGDLGLSGFLIFILMMLNSLFSVRRIKKLVEPQGASLQWAADLASMLGLCITVFLITGAAVSLAYYEVVYVIVMLVEVLRQIVVREVSKAAIDIPRTIAHA